VAYLIVDILQSMFWHYISAIVSSSLLPRCNFSGSPLSHRWEHNCSRLTAYSSVNTYAQT